MLLLLTAIHPLVDACSVGVLVAGGITWERAVAYNATAFALQLPIGVVMDELPRFSRCGFFVGTCLLFAASVAAALGLGGWGVLVAACVGNALFHLTAGKRILESRQGRSGPVGLFISTGALGLVAGQVWAERAASVCLWAFAAALAACVGVAAAMGRSARWRMDAPVRNAAAARLCPGGVVLPVLALAGLFALTAWRSWAAVFAGGRSAGGCAAMLLAGALVAFAGKAAGGYLAERAGRRRVVAFSVAGSVSLAFFCEPSWTAVWFALLFVAQLATGPVLSLLYDVCGRRGGMAFGLNCLGLFVGGIA